MARRLISVFCAYWLTFALVYACEIDYPIWIQRSPTADPLYRFIRNGKMGFIDHGGKIVVKPKLDYLGVNYGDEFEDGLLAIDSSGGVYVDRNGKTVIDKSFARSRIFSEGLAVAKSEDSGKWGYINTKGEWVISPRFDNFPKGYVGPFLGGLAEIEAAGKVGYIDPTGAFAISPRFLQGDYFLDGMARVVVEGPCMYSSGPCGDFSGLPKGTKFDPSLPPCKYTFVDRRGNIVSEDRYDGAGAFSEGLAPVRIERQWGYIDKTGKMVIAPQFEAANSFSEGVALVSSKGRYGYIDHAGKYVIAPQFSYAESFSDGLAVVGSRDSGVWYMDHTGKQAIPGKYQIASGFFKGLAHVRLKSVSADEALYLGNFAYIDRAGRRVFSYTIKDDDFR